MRGGSSTIYLVVSRGPNQTLRWSTILNSDERSAGTVTGRIQNAIDAGSGLASNGKPTCVIIDEIDGVGGGGDQVSTGARCARRHNGCEELEELKFRRGV
jgi:chromosome transmission fidelity protein 18